MPNMSYDRLDAGDLEIASGLYAEFCSKLASDAGGARSWLIANIQVKLREARDDGVRIGVRARRVVESTQDHT